MKSDPRTIYPGTAMYGGGSSMGMGFNNYGQLPASNFTAPIGPAMGMTATQPQQTAPLSALFAPSPGAMK